MISLYIRLGSGNPGITSLTSDNDYNGGDTDLTLTRQQRALTRASPSPDDSRVTCHSLSSRRKGASSLASVSESTWNSDIIEQFIKLSIQTFFSRYSNSRTDSDRNLSTTESLFASKHLIMV